MKIVSFTPIKLNNQRLPGKNTMDLNGLPLCSYIFNTLLEVNGITERYVYCSDERIKEFIPKGISFLKRDSYLDGNEVKGLEIIDRFVEDVDADIYVLIHATQPFTKASSVQLALDKVVGGKFDSAFSAILLQDYLWYQGHPVNYDMKNIVRTQDLEPVYMETGAFYIFTRGVYKKLHQRIGNTPYFCEVDKLEAHEIDTPEDFEFAKVTASYLSGLE